MWSLHERTICLSQVEYTADSLKLDVLELARTGNKLLAVSGRPEWMCQAVEVADPVTFTTPDTVLVSQHVNTYNLKRDWDLTNEPKSPPWPVCLNPMVTVDAAILGGYENGIHVLQNPNEWAEWIAVVQ